MKYPILPIAIASVLIISCCPATGMAQDENDLAKVQHFESGELDISLSATSLLLFGPGAGGLYTTIAPVYPRAGRHLHNPAILGLNRRPTLSLDYAPGLNFDLGSFFDLEEEINSSINEGLEEHLADDGTITSADASAQLSHPGGLSGLSFSVPVGQFSFALSLDRAFKVDLSILASGFQTWADIEKEVGDRSEVVHMRTDMDISTDINLATQRYSLAGGYSPLPGLWTGVGFDWLYCRARANGLVVAEGLMSTGGREFAFGDPADPWENSLDQYLACDYSGHTWSTRLGAAWAPGKRFSFGTTLNINRRADLHGKAILELHRLAAYSEEDGIDPSELSLSSPTETEIVETPVDDTLGLEFPSNLSLATAMLLGPLITSLDYQYYWGDFSLRYLDSRFDLNPKHAFKLGLYSPILSLSTGVILCSPELVHDDGWQEDLIPLPSLVLGGGGRITHHIRLDIISQILPSPSVKISTGVLF